MISAAGEIERLLAPIVRGPLPVRLTAWDGSTAGPPDAPRVTVSSPDALRRQLWACGELGAAQAYVTGEIDVDGDLGAALEEVWAVVRSRELGGVRPTPRTMLRVLTAAWRLRIIGLPPRRPESQARLRGRPHAMSRDRAAITHHYDLSNEFYRILLDPTMAYSCAFFARNVPGAPADPDYGIEDAQRDKLDLVCRTLGLRPGMRLLDVGCGWGSLSIHAAAEYGARVVGITLSEQQKAFAQARVAQYGLDDFVDIRLQDYRTLADRDFDAAASLEMGEHVGDGNYPRFARTLFEAVRPGAPVLIQQMSRAGQHRGGGAFIESFIAPDMTMRPLGQTVALLEEAGLEVRQVRAMREHYVWTLDAWIATLEARWDQVVALVGEEVARVWRLYLVGARLSFAQGRMGVDQIVATRPVEPGLAPARRDGTSRDPMTASGHRAGSG